MLILLWCYFRRERVKASGGEVGRLSILGGAEVRVFTKSNKTKFVISFPNLELILINLQVGPLRCWPGGLCLSRSIGDMDVGEFIVPIPYVKQVKVTITIWF